MNILYYITSHGYGHGVRSAAVGNCFSPDVNLFLRTGLPRKFFEEEMTRPYALYPSEFDCGCIQSDSVTVDVEGTVRRYSSIAGRNAARLDEEVAWCVAKGVDAVVSDIVPFAFEVADRLGVPSFAATNFTWYDIYAPYSQLYPQFVPVVEKIRAQYGLATHLLQMQPSEGLDYFPARHGIPPVGRLGENVRARLAASAGVDPSSRIGLIYPGTFGMDAVSWRGLERFSGWEFFGLYRIPEGPANYHLVSKKDFRYQDLTASADLVISKLGYSTVAECMLNGTSLLFLPRERFAEYPVLERAVGQWGGGFLLKPEDYNDLRWDGVLDQVATGSRPAPVPPDGARKCARFIEEEAAIRKNH